ncbi:MAG: DUF3892 domain-containing protein [Bacteroidia bacterium]|nr:DUF3892 domain-containing protein [Bacteroidia bacterium]
MAKWADYVITGVWFSGEHISYVMLHEDKGESISSPGEKMSREKVVQMIKNGKTVVTSTWNYQKGTWSKGADVGYETVKGVDYLRSHKDKVVTDNLDNLIKMHYFLG